MGQLHVHPVRLDEVARYDEALLGTIEAVDLGRRTVRLRVKKVYRRGKKGIVTGAREKRVAWFRDVRELEVYGGVVWDDPHVSPVDRRVQNALALESLVNGDAIVAIPNNGFELIRADAPTRAKLDLLFSERALRRYRRRATVTELTRDLADPDLSELALNALIERQVELAPALLTLSEDRFYRVVFDLSQEASAALLENLFDAFARSAAPPERRARIYDLARESTLRDKISPAVVRRIVDTLDPKDENHFNRLSWYAREQSENTRGASDVADIAFHLEEVRARSGDANDDAVVRRVLADLPESERSAWMVKLCALVSRSKVAESSPVGLDERLFDLAIAAIKQRPARVFVEHLAAIDLSRYPKTMQRLSEASVALLDAGLAIAEADPASTGDVYRALERWAKNDAAFDRDDWQATRHRFMALRPK